MNPQAQYGADVISRIQCVLEGRGDELRHCIRQALAEMALALAQKAGITPERITAAAVVGNTAMHHLLLGIDPRPLITPPYMPEVRRSLEVPGFPGVPCKIRFLPNIAGFVGGDTLGYMVATRFDRLEKLTLLIDIGTNGEMVLGDKRRRIACSTAAGPAPSRGQKFPVEYGERRAPSTMYFWKMGKSGSTCWVALPPGASAAPGCWI